MPHSKRNPDCAVTLDSPPSRADAASPPRLSWAYREYRLALTEGNEAFCIGAHRMAEAPYARALRIAERLFQRASQNGIEVEQAAEAVVDARHNTAENLMRLGRCAEALTHLRAAVTTLCQGRRVLGATPHFRDSCESELPRALEAVVHYLQRTDAPPEQIAAAYTAAVTFPLQR